MREMSGDRPADPVTILSNVLPSVLRSDCRAVPVPSLRRQRLRIRLCSVCLSGSRRRTGVNSSVQIQRTISFAKHHRRLALGRLLRSADYRGTVRRNCSSSASSRSDTRKVSALAEIVARRAAKPLLKCLRRRRYTQTQTILDRDHRVRNLHNAFDPRKSTAVLGKRILLVDDVLTTGTTLHECAKVLRSGGAVSVRAVTVARG